MLARMIQISGSSREWASSTITVFMSAKRGPAPGAAMTVAIESNVAIMKELDSKISCTILPVLGALYYH